ncbi:hypothetical protein QVD99_002746 [Batrachochytrium dendrobatidis]|nr:hypothetical protein O5D80_006969 [Batrachochytrium dendrobatidis]KAK5670975.1 hypothetical protein QVD99_002746 [Batrachochytrium dendrobatidis]
MSCILVGLTAIKVEPDSFSTKDLTWCMFRDIVILAIHSILIALYGKDGCIKDASSNNGPLSWLILDMSLTALRLVKNPIHYFANRALERSGSQWRNPSLVGFGFVGTLFYSRFCGMRIFTIIDWFTYIAWIFGISTVRTDSSCQNPIAIAVQWELTAATIVYFTCIVLFATLFLLNKTTLGHCFPGFTINNSRWPDACPTLLIDRTQWRQANESVTDYRARRRSIFLNQNPITQQPTRMQTALMNRGLSVEELNQLRTFVYSKEPVAPNEPTQTSDDLSKADDKCVAAIVVVSEKNSNNLPLSDVQSSKSDKTTNVQSENATNPSSDAAETTTTDDHSAIEVLVHGNGSMQHSALDRQTTDTAKMTPHNLCVTPDQVDSLHVIKIDDSLLSSHAVALKVPHPKSPIEPLTPDTVSRDEHVNKPEQERTTDQTCALCLCDYENDDFLRELHCIHRFHAECIDEWLIGKKRTCPVCNQDALGVSFQQRLRESLPAVANPTPLTAAAYPPWLEDRSALNSVNHNQENSTRRYASNMEISHTDSDSPQPALSNDSTTPVPPLPSDQVTGVFPSRDTVTLAHNGTNSSALPEDSTFTTRPSPHVNNSQTVLRNFFEQNANDRFLRWFRPSRNTRQVTSHGASNTLPSMQQTSTPTDTLVRINMDTDRS